MINQCSSYRMTEKTLPDTPIARIRPPPEVNLDSCDRLVDVVENVKTLLQEHGYVLLSGLDDMTPSQMKGFMQLVAPEKETFMIPFNDEASKEVTQDKTAPACIPEVPQVRVLGRGHGNALLADIGVEWHQDGGGTAPFWTLLHCKEACPGADTLFADGDVLFQRLSPQEQALARNLVGVYSNKYTAGGPTALDALYGVQMSPCGTRRVKNATRRKEGWTEGRFEKPIIQFGSDGKERFLSGAKMLETFVGYEEEENGQEVLSKLLRSALGVTLSQTDDNEHQFVAQFSPDAVYRHQWKTGQALLWDNDRMIHSTTPLSAYENGKNRLMWQIIAKVNAMAAPSAKELI